MKAKPGPGERTERGGWGEGDEDMINTSIWFQVGRQTQEAPKNVSSKFNEVYWSQITKILYKIILSLLYVGQDY